MSLIVVNVEHLLGPPNQKLTDDDLLVEFSESDPPAVIEAAFRKLWALVMCMSVRDRATSVHYHPWRGAGALSYVVDNVRYELDPPPAEYAGVCVAAARAMFAAPPGFLARRIGRARVSCGTVRLIVGAPTRWDAVVWSTGERAGVDMYRVTPLGEVERE